MYSKRHRHGLRTFAKSVVVIILLVVIATILRPTAIDADDEVIDNSYSSNYIDLPDEIETADGDYESLLGNYHIIVGNTTLTRYDLPNVYYPNIDYSSFQPYMSYKLITNSSSPAYEVVWSPNAYVDDSGMLRYRVSDDQFSIDGIDDYVIALGTYYKAKGTCGSRYLIVTTTGAYTAITGDEKADEHTDSHHMFSNHGGKAGLIEWLVDTSAISNTMRQMGTVTAGNIQAAKGKILYIYSIN